MPNAQQHINDAPDTSGPVRKANTTSDLSPQPDGQPPPCIPPQNPDETINTLLADLRDCEATMLKCRLRAAARYAWARRNLPAAEWRRLFKEKRLGIGIREVQMLCRVGDNLALWWDTANHPHFPNSVAALSELAALKPDIISRLCEENLITPKMTTRQAKALVKKTLADEAGAIHPSPARLL